MSIVWFQVFAALYPAGLMLWAFPNRMHTPISEMTDMDWAMFWTGSICMGAMLALSVAVSLPAFFFMLVMFTLWYAL